MAKKPQKNPEIVDDLNKVVNETTPEAPVSETVNDDLDALLNAEIERLITETTPVAPTIMKAGSEKAPKVARPALKKVGLAGQKECEVVLTLNIFGQVLPADQILNGIRTQIQNPVFNKRIAPESSVFARFARACNVIFAKAGYEFALVTPDRVAVDGKFAVSLDDVLVNAFENGKDSKVSSPLSHPEISLAVRFYLQCVIASQLLAGNTKARFFAVGKSETYNHVSSTSQNFSKILRACVEPYDTAEPKVFFDTDQFDQPRLAYAKAGIFTDDNGNKALSQSTAYSIKEIASLPLSSCNDMVKPDSILAFDKLGDFIALLEVLSEKMMNEPVKSDDAKP